VWVCRVDSKRTWGLVLVLVLVPVPVLGQPSNASIVRVLRNAHGPRPLLGACHPRRLRDCASPARRQSSTPITHIPRPLHLTCPATLLERAVRHRPPPTMDNELTPSFAPFFGMVRPVLRPSAAPELTVSRAALPSP